MLQLQAVLDDSAHLTAHRVALARPQVLHLLDQMREIEVYVRAGVGETAQRRRLAVRPDIEVLLIQLLGPGGHARGPFESAAGYHIGAGRGKARARAFTPEPGPGHNATMQIHRGYWSLPHAALHGVVAIGNFDGVHRGHRALIEAARARAEELGAPLGVVTFEPHPREVLTPDQAPPRLTPFRVKARILAELGVDHLYALAFNEYLMSKSPEQFVHDVLAGGLGVRHVVVGFDFRFGHKRAGDADTLVALGHEYGFGVTRFEPVAWRGEVCSSSRIRAAVAKGDVPPA